jgi:predicted ferric reductase
LKEAEFIWGLVGIIGLDLLAFLSTEFWRSRHYNVFLYAHILGFIMFPLGVAMHKPVTRPWVYGAVGVYALDHIMRLLKTRFAVATLRPIPDLGSTRVEVSGINAGWRAGQHVRIRVLSSGMGVLGWSEVHPFTIASASGDGNGLVLICKKTGSWTNSLFDLAKGGPSSGEKGITSTNATVVIEGPYGGVGHTMMDGFSGAFFVAGGSGITFALASMQELIQKDIAGKSRVKAIQLLWSVQDPSLFQPPFFSVLHVDVL